MFAYCGNNPVTRFDYTGHVYNGIYAQFNYAEYEHTYGGLRSNFYALPPMHQHNYGLILAAMNASAAYGVSVIFPWYGKVDASIGFLSIYDLCRSEGLSYFDSIIGAVVFCIIPDSITSISSDSMSINIIVDVAADQFLANYIDKNRPTPDEAARNRENHFSEKQAFVAVSGSMKYIAFDTTEMGDLIGRP